MPAIRRGYVDIPSGQVHYWEAGSGDPLLLIHQSPLSGKQFEKAIPLIADAGFHVIATDTPGYGMSDRLPEDPTIESYGAALIEFLDAMGIEKTAVLGHHTCACTACELAASYPDRISKLIMHGVPVYRDHERDAILGRWRREPLEIKESGNHLIEPWRRRLEITIGWSNLEAMTRNIVDTLAVRDRQWLGFVAAFSYSMWTKMESVKVPGMILTNTGEDLYLLSRRARKIRPDFTYVELEGGTHDIVDEQPENWANAVVNYLRS